ncbi:MAG: hypothetical protein IJX64_05130 [Clostridia bacterium]|nr:hypothetical protein [Clostridia bacterium]
MKDSVFYNTADAVLQQEIGRIEAFTGNLDKNPTVKKEQIAEYKCAKYRYAAVSRLHCMLRNCRRYGEKFRNHHYLLLPLDEILQKRQDYLTLYDNAPDEEKPDYGLYYGMLEFADTLIAEVSQKLPLATDWEKIELECRLDGYCFGKKCLEDAWRAGEKAHA